MYLHISYTLDQCPRYSHDLNTTQQFSVHAYIHSLKYTQPSKPFYKLLLTNVIRSIIQLFTCI